MRNSSPRREFRRCKDIFIVIYLTQFVKGYKNVRKNNWMVQSRGPHTRSRLLTIHIPKHPSTLLDSRSPTATNRTLLYAQAKLGCSTEGPTSGTKGYASTLGSSHHILSYIRNLSYSRLLKNVISL